MKENAIRDLLVTNLGLLEHGLVHMETEYHLRNPIGGKGFIDILARDPVGHRVIIEVKRSDTSAREAIHELCKYVALFKATHGLPHHRLRCFVVSTDWHELLVPFAEFVRASDFQVEGFLLRVAPDGTPLSAEKIDLPIAPTTVDLFIHHDILLYANAKRRDDAAVPLAEQLLQGGAESAFICRLDNSHLKGKIPYPYALYSVVAGLNPEVRMTIEEHLREEYETDELDSLSGTIVEEEFSSRTINVMVSECDSYEIGYPDKLSAMLRGDWRCLGIVRRGRMTSPAAMSDVELLDDIQGMGGKNTILYHRLATPRVSGSWENFRRSAHTCLRGNPSWEKDFQLFCDLVERDHPNSMVAAKIYNPLALPLTIYKLIIRGDLRYWPVMEIVSSDADANSAILFSRLEWNGGSCVDSVAELFDGIAEDPFEYFTLYNFGEAWSVDEELKRRLGLEYQSFVVKPLAGDMSQRYALASVSNGVSLIPTSAPNENSLDQYVATNWKLLSELCLILDSYSNGL